jgi:hypothetical protein
LQELQRIMMRSHADAGQASQLSPGSASARQAVPLAAPLAPPASLAPGRMQARPRANGVPHAQRRAIHRQPAVLSAGPAVLGSPPTAALQPPVHAAAMASPAGPRPGLPISRRRKADSIPTSRTSAMTVAEHRSTLQATARRSMPAHLSTPPAASSTCSCTSHRLINGQVSCLWCPPAPQTIPVASSMPGTLWVWPFLAALDMSFLILDLLFLSQVGGEGSQHHA